jgi:hypothetical protein
VSPDDDVTTDVAPAQAVDANLLDAVDTGNLTPDEAVKRSQHPVTCVAGTANRVAVSSTGLGSTTIRYSGQVRCDVAVDQSGQASLRNAAGGTLAQAPSYSGSATIARSTGTTGASGRTTKKVAFQFRITLTPDSVWASVPAGCSGKGTSILFCTIEGKEFR